MGGADGQVPPMDANLPPASKKRGLNDGGAETFGTQGLSDKLETLVGDLPPTVGEGEYQQATLMGMMQAITETARDVAELRAATTLSYEGPVQWSYAASAKSCTTTFVEHARRVKGTGVNLGPPKNYAATGLMQAFLEDTQVTGDAKSELRALLRDRVMETVNDTERITLKHAKKMEDLVTYCQVTIGKKASYINLQYANTVNGQNLRDLMEEALTKTGHRQWDATSLKPIHRELKDAYAKARGKGKGKGR